MTQTIKKANRPETPPPFDWEGFKLSVGVGGAVLGLGVLLGWGVLTAPEGGPTTTGYTTAQRLARMLPNALQEQLALGLAGLFVLFGAFLLLAGLGTVVKHLLARIRSGK